MAPSTVPTPRMVPSLPARLGLVALLLARASSAFAFSGGVRRVPPPRLLAREDPTITVVAGTVAAAGGRFAFGHTARPRTSIATSLGARANDDDSDDGLEDESSYEPPPSVPYDDEDDVRLLSRREAESLTVSQLKQQLRLRGLKVSGRKGELVDRLVGRVGEISDTGVAAADASVENIGSAADGAAADILEPEVILGANEALRDNRRSVADAAARAKAAGMEPVDVTAYLDEEEKGKKTRTVRMNAPSDEDVEDVAGAEEGVGGDEDGEEPEAWGEKARIVDDFEGRSPVVDGLSRSVVEFTGSNQTKVQAYVSASRDALKRFLAGGSPSDSEPMKRLFEVQSKRERAARLPPRFDDDSGADDPNDDGAAYQHVVERDESDWGPYTQTGATISSQEVQGVLLLSDVYGAFGEDTKALADKIAFECQPVVVMVPDLFRGDPWDPDGDESSYDSQRKDKKGRTYEEWRSEHDDLRVSVDVRAAASCLRNRYGCPSVAVWGTCYGGGRALEAASGWTPNGTVHDVDGVAVGPPHVNPMACVAWYPTRYDAGELFGKDRPRGPFPDDGKEVAVMAIFGGEDTLDGATPDDASKLKSLLEEDPRVKDHMVKVFPGAGHGFAHRGMGGRDDVTGATSGDSTVERFVDEEFGGAGSVSIDDGDAEVACLLSTAWMETYTRVFLPTVGPAVKDEGNEGSGWGAGIEAPDFGGTERRDVRKELEEAMSSHEYMKVGQTYAEEGDGDYEDNNGKSSFANVNGRQVLSDADVDRIYEDLKAEGVLSEERIPGFMKNKQEGKSISEADVDEFMNLVVKVLDKSPDHAVSPDDDLSTAYAKLRAADEEGVLDDLLGEDEPNGMRSLDDPSLDDTFEAYW